ncbi:DUF6503 family protein [Pontibacter flavimaris]|uniref:Deoxyribose-phosphate aldolase n=1 Tax=Pontibacter flavimaris TaxID=1797110 RepID=A0A1Q5PBD2_9BACT|nr:DUF6503 family protein [Pontibacter flavimaris]OKL39507.1 hypothetical protein A3841_02380 [Pontibacter flavimaris]
MTKYTFSWLLLGMLLLFTACSGNQTQRSEAQAVVDAALEAHGSPKLNKSVVTFKLRDIQYRALRDNGAYVYSRTFTDSTGQRIHDVLSNSGFKRTVDDVEAKLPEEKAQAYSNSVNAVIYFALLPYFLNDAAVQKSYLGEVQVKGEPYHKVKVTFAQEGGGEGFQDQYIYWFHKDRHTMDYLAYDFQENGGGSRFREVSNVQEVGGIRFQDYHNYKAADKDFPIENYDRAFEAGKLEKVSEINLDEVQVRELE